MQRVLLKGRLMPVLYIPGTSGFTKLLLTKRKKIHLRYNVLNQVFVPVKHCAKGKYTATLLCVFTDSQLYF